MTQQRDGQVQGRATRGSVALRILLIIVGLTLILFGAVIAMATIGITLEGDPSILFLLPGSIASLIGGIYIMVKQAQMGKADKEAKQAEAASERIVSAVPITGPGAGTTQPVPTPAEVPTPVSSEAEEVARLVLRSNDLFATLRDLVRHGSAQKSDKRHLVSMLEAAGVMDWQDAPACEGGRLSRNTHFWIRMPVDELSNANYDTLISAEAALNVNQDLPSMAKRSLTEPAVEEACLKLMRDMVSQRIDRGPLTSEGLRTCYRDEAALGSGDWLVRSIVCNAAECIRTPFRVVYDLRLNIKEGLVVLSLEAPRPGCFAIFTADKGEQATYARAYALRLSALMAAHAFDTSDLVTRVVVNCHEFGSDQTILSLDITPKVLASLLKVAQRPILDEGFPTDEHIRATVDGEAWLAPVEPFVAIDSPEAVPEEATVFPELITRETSEAVVRTCGAKRVCDLGINENAARIACWNKIRNELGDKVETAASVLVAARDAASDITVAEACNRTMQALINGEADLDNRHELSQLFVEGSALDRAVSRANKLLNDENGNEDPEAALSLLRQGGITAELGWVEMGGYGLYALLTDPELPEGDELHTLAKGLLETELNDVLALIAANPYGISRSDTYEWGSNMGVANTGVLLLMAGDVLGDETAASAALRQLDYLLGENAVGYCFVTGMGSLSPEHPHHRPSQLLGQAMPGMLVGGPNSNLEDPYAANVLRDAASARCYADSDQSFSTIEVTIYWNSPLIALLSAAA